MNHGTSINTWTTIPLSITMNHWTCINTFTSKYFSLNMNHGTSINTRTHIFLSIPMNDGTSITNWTPIFLSIPMNHGASINTLTTISRSLYLWITGHPSLTGHPWIASQLPQWHNHTRCLLGFPICLSSLSIMQFRTKQQGKVEFAKILYWKMWSKVGPSG